MGKVITYIVIIAALGSAGTLFGAFVAFLFVVDITCYAFRDSSVCYLGTISLCAGAGLLGGIVGGFKFVSFCYRA